VAELNRLENRLFLANVTIPIQSHDRRVGQIISALSPLATLNVAPLAIQGAIDASVESCDAPGARDYSSERFGASELLHRPLDVSNSAQPSPRNGRSFALGYR
jgi:hypothetical protein